MSRLFVRISAVFSIAVIICSCSSPVVGTEALKASVEILGLPCTSSKIRLKPTRNYFPSSRSIDFKTSTTFGFPLPFGCIQNDAEFQLVAIKSDKSESLLTAGVFSLQDWDADVPGYDARISNLTKKTYIRWIRIDAIVAIENHEVPELELRFRNPTNATDGVDRFDLDRGKNKNNWLAIGPTPFIDDDTYFANSPEAARYANRFRVIRSNGQNGGLSEYYCKDLIKKDVYKSSVYTKYKLEGSYLGLEQEPLAACEIIVKKYHQTGMERLYHTITWLRRSSDDEKLVSMDFLYGDVQSAFAVFDKSRPELVDSTSYTQLKDSVEPITQDDDKHIRWIEVDTPRRRLVTVRWAKEQYPNGFDFKVSDGGTQSLYIRLLGFGPNHDETTHLRFSNTGLAVPEIAKQRQGDKAHEARWDLSSIRGLSKTHEIIIADISDAKQHADTAAQFAEHPLVYRADPVVMAASKQPVYWSPAKAKSKDLIDKAIENSLDFMRNTIESNDSELLGWVYHGARHWSFQTAPFDEDIKEEFQHRPPYRYWNNHDGISNNLAWIQWLRTGATRHLDYAEASSRHLMDLATYNGPEEDAFNPGSSTHPAIPGSQYHYAQTPYGNFAHGFSGFVSESDYLLSYCFLLGYDRACDHLKRRQLKWCDFDINNLRFGDIGKSRVWVARLHELLLHLRDPIIKKCGKEDFETIVTSRIEEILVYLENKTVREYTNKGPYFLDAKLAASAEYDNRFRERVRALLTRIYEYYGYYGDRPTSTLETVSGPYPLLNIYDQEGTSKDGMQALERAIAVAYGHALVVNAEPIDDWLGSSISPFHFLAADVREWITVNAYRSNEKLDLDPTASPSNFFAGKRAGTHTAYTRCTRTTAGTLEVKSEVLNGLPGNRLWVLDSKGLPVGKSVLNPETNVHQVTVNPCIPNTDYKILLQIAPGKDRSYSIVTNSGKLVHELKSNLVRSLSPHVGGTVWIKVHDKSQLDGVSIPINVAMRDINVKASRAGKLVAVHFSAVKRIEWQVERLSNQDNCTSLIVATRSDLTADQSDCIATVKNNSLVGITSLLTLQDSIGNGSIVLKKALGSDHDEIRVGDSMFPQHFGHCVAASASEYFDTPVCDN